MQTILDKKSILKKTAQVASSTLLSRFLGIIRVTLLGKFLGAGLLSDAFLTAFLIPNSFRKFFAEGALSAVFTPKLVALIHKKHYAQAHSLLTLGFIIFEGFVLLLCLFVMTKAYFVTSIIAPGFSPEQIQRTVPLLRILMPFIFFLSSSALLTGALQSVGHFFISAFSPVLLNIVFIVGLIVCLIFNFSVETFCFFVLFGGFVQLMAHLWVYMRLNFAFGPVNVQAWRNFWSVLIRFIPCCISMGFIEISLIIDEIFASYLPAGSISSIHYAHRFMGIPLGVFAVAFSTILLPHFSRISTYAPKRLSFYLLESGKLIFWVSVPAALVMSFFSFNIFETIFLAKNFSMEHVLVSQSVLNAFLCGLFFFSLNKILLNIFYALHVASIPTVVSCIATLGNIGANALLITRWQAPGLAFATTLSGVLQTALYIYFLYVKYGFTLYWQKALIFMARYLAQLTTFFVIFYYVYRLFYYSIAYYAGPLTYFLLHSIGFWLWVGPLTLIFFVLLFYTRRLFGIQLYFLD